MASSPARLPPRRAEDAAALMSAACPTPAAHADNKRLNDSVVLRSLSDAGRGVAKFVIVPVAGVTLVGPLPAEVPKPGLHLAESGKNRVVWWDPKTLELAREERTGLEASDALLARYGHAWRHPQAPQ